MKDARMKPIELARRAGISRATVSLWLSGQTKTISGNKLVRVARTLGVDPAYLSGDAPLEAREPANAYAAHSSDENRLLSRYRLLGELDKERVMAIMDILSKTKKG